MIHNIRSAATATVFLDRHRDPRNKEGCVEKRDHNQILCSFLAPRLNEAQRHCQKNTQYRSNSDNTKVIAIHRCAANKHYDGIQNAIDLFAIEIGINCISSTHGAISALAEARVGGQLYA